MPTDEVDVVVGGDHDGICGRTQIDLAEDHVEALEAVAPDGDDDERRIAAGYSAFSSSLDLLRALTRVRGDFVAGVNDYLTGHKMRMAPAVGWLDFGQSQTFHRSQLSVSTVSEFSSPRTDGLTTRKSDADKPKIQAEAAWLDAAPPALKPYCARVVEAGEDGDEAFYRSEYDYLPPLSDLFVYGALGRKAWIQILGSCEAFLRLCADHRDAVDDGDALGALVEATTLERLETFARASGFPIDRDLAYEGRAGPSLVAMAEALNARIKSRKPRADP